ncbi:hypothetical protein [Methylotenera sp.]|uniref:hypothetical protein n=1 Tax=Methylotenera sp. TaxID=2051956 RepID=UPI00248706DD|nr:hypothetical protein [Methylotenera sp.]MDI1299993.1 hypothetical protein [Methylotenera sp.]
MNKSREHVALSAYLNLLERKGFTKVELRQREVIILKLIPWIENIHCDGNAFRDAVEQLFKNLDKSMWFSYLPVIREFFSFWIDDIKAVVAMNQDNAFGANLMKWKPGETELKNLWESLDKHTLTKSEMQPLEEYEKVLRGNGVEEFAVSACKKLAKLLLILLRSAPHKQPVAYRHAVDANLTLFSSNEAYKVILKVGREFYYFWKGDVNAADLDQHVHA